MSDSDNAANEAASQSPTSDEDRWLLDRYKPTPEDKEEWEAAGMPPDIEIVAGFLMSNNLVFGVPDRAEIFHLAQLAKEQDDRGVVVTDQATWMQLRVIQPTPLPFVTYVLAHPPIGVEMGDIVEHNYNVRIQAISRAMFLYRIRVLHGSEIDESQPLVFEGTEFPGAPYLRNVRVVKITVYAQYATWEIVSETKYNSF